MAPTPTVDIGDKLLTLGQVMEIVGLSRTTIYSEINAGRFPKSRRCGRKSVRWRASDIRSWMAENPTMREIVAAKRRK